MGLARIALPLAAASAWLLWGPRFVQARPAASPIVVAADQDDDDVNGTPDGREDILSPFARQDLVSVGGGLVGGSIKPSTGSAVARLIASGRPLAWGDPMPPSAFIQGLAPGVVHAVATHSGREEDIVIDVIGVSFRDGQNKDLDTTEDHASVERTPPARIEGDPESGFDDEDALRVVLTEPVDVPTGGIVSVESVGPTGAVVDRLARLALSAVGCRPPSPTLRCLASAPLRFVVDEVDRRHSLVESRSLRAQVGGAIVVRREGRKLQAIRVMGPRASSLSSAGPHGILQATLRPIVMRVVARGGPAIGGTDMGATALLRAELELASAIWGQCGVTFDRGAPLEVHIMDPPPPHLVAIGDDLALPASGGELRLRADGRLLIVPIAHGSRPHRIAQDLLEAAHAVGLVALVSSNTRIAPAAAGSVDVSLRRRNGGLVAVEPIARGAPLCTDATVTVRIGSVDLSDGLQHFGDMDSMAGTLEERTLLKAIDDNDPKTIEIVIVPFFSGGARIGESFIRSGSSSVRNVVLLDRAGIRARRSSLTLAHEIGHVLLDMPGHPDDFGVDTPSLLMDSDASDSSPFGPRRIPTEQCARVLRESGPLARVPLLDALPLLPIHYRGPP